MKKTKLLLVGSLLVTTLATLPGISSAHSRHHGGGVRFGLSIGVPLAIGGAYGYGAYHYGPRGYAAWPAPVYYYPPVAPVAPIVVQQAPITYIEQAPQVATAPLPSGSWYYCDGARAYYPYVKECPGGWQPVPATPQR